MGNEGNIFQGTLPQLAAVLAATLTAISDGMLYGWTSPILPILLGPDGPIQITEVEGEWLEKLLMIGSFCGLLPTIFFVEKLGRKKAILLATFVTLCVWIVTALVPRIEYLYAARAFGGAAGNMAFVAAPMYIAEIADQKIRGFLSSLIYLMMLVGIFLVYTVVPYTPYYAHCILGAILVILELIIFPFMPDSPFYLVYINKPEEAKKSLKRLRSKGSNIEKELEEIISSVERQKTEKGRPIDLIKIPSNRRALIIMLILNWSQHFSSISVMLMNLHLILDAAGSIYLGRATAGTLFAALMVLAVIIGCILMDRCGRKYLLMISGMLTGTSLLILAIFFTLKHNGYDVDGASWLPIMSVMMYAFFFKTGMGLVPIVLTAELFPAKVKAMGVTLSDSIYVISSLLSLQIYQSLKHLGWEYPFYVFSASCFVAVIFTYFCIPETKGKSLEEIQWILKGEKFERSNTEKFLEKNLMIVYSFCKFNEYFGCYKDPF